ncbi:MAG TPA: hypothetical protein VGR26_07200 [Acidimicrobiales bacterium]|nr:hypothetical protein [Acidimicrobiales bacterium]
MPGWDQLPEVGFDFGAAREAAEACREMAILLGNLLDARTGAGGRAADGWEGRSRTEFDSIGEALRREGSDLRQQLLQSAAAIEDAADDAAHEQRRRTAENERRQEELEALERAHQARREAVLGGDPG